MVTKKETTTEKKKPAKKVALKPGKKTKAGPKSKTAEVKEKKVKPAKVGEPKPLHGKKYRAAAEKIEADKLYPLEEALELAIKSSTTKFDASVELHVRIAQEARGMISFPKPTGKTIKAVLFSDEVAEELKKGKINFDILLAKPAQMADLAKYAKLLGPKGLMPNPKSGTVTEDVEAARKELEGGKTEYRTDEGKNIHLVVGKTKSKTEDLLTNINEAIKVLTVLRVVALTITTTMGPGVKVELPE